MTKNRFNQANRSTGRWHYQSASNLTLNKARDLFLEDNDKIDMKDTYKITKLHPLIDQKDVN